MSTERVGLSVRRFSPFWLSADSGCFTPAYTA